MSAQPGSVRRERDESFGDLPVPDATLRWAGEVRHTSERERSNANSRRIWTRSTHLQSLALGSLFVPGGQEPVAETAPQSRDVPHARLSETLSHHGTRAESESLRDVAKGGGWYRGPLPPPWELLASFPKRSAGEGRNSQAALEGHQEARRLKTGPALWGPLNFYRTAKLPACSCKNRSQGVAGSEP